MAMMTARNTDDGPSDPAPDAVRFATSPCPRVKARTTIVKRIPTFIAEKATWTALPSLTPR